jgi:hypothetical protein
MTKFVPAATLSTAVLSQTFRARALSLLLAACASAVPAIQAAPAAAAAPTGVTIVHVFSGWRDAPSFKRISEYFTGVENTGGETMLRTHPDQRAGFYFLVRVANAGTALPVKMILQIIAVNEAKARQYSFATDLKVGETVLELGVTGADWPDAKANPIAWKLDVLADDGRALATKESYVWEKPPATP